MKPQEIRVLIADGDNTLTTRMSQYLRESGFVVKVMSNSHLLHKTLLEWRPQFLFIDLLFPGCYAQNCLQFLKDRKLLGENGISVVVMSNHNAELNVRNCLIAGADDFVVKPLKLIELLQRLALLVQSRRYDFSALLSQSEQEIKNYFQMIDLLVRASNQSKEPSTLRFELIQMLAIALKAVRISIVLASEDKKNIKVVRSSDDSSLQSLALDLQKYPEIQYVLRTEKPLFIESLEKDQTMAFVKQEVKSIQFDSMMVLPLYHSNQLLGCLSIRMPKDCKQLSYYDMKIADIGSQLIAMTWKFKNIQIHKQVA